ncbi:MAG: hypothetical protein ABEJ40_12195 [Haloarculaceae archaeon]
MAGETLYEDTDTVSTDGVTVERELSCKESGITVVLAIESDREDAVMVHVVDDIPDGFPADDVAFRPGSEPDMGEAATERISVKQTVEDDPVRVEYGILPSEPVAEVRWGAPTVRDVSVVDFTRSTDATGPPPDENGVHGDEDVFRQIDETADTESDVARESASGSDSDDPASAESRRATSTRRPARDDPTSVTGSDVPRSFEVRLDRVGARIEEFNAYAAALEGIIDEHGTGTEVVDRIDRELDHLDDRIDDETDRLGGEIDRLGTEIGRVGEETVRLDGEIDRLDTAVERQGSDLASLEGDVAAVESRLDGVESEVTELRQTVGEFRDEMETVREDVGAIREEMAAIRDEVEALQSFRRSLAEISDLSDE